MNRQCHTNPKEGINSKESIKLYIELSSLSVGNFVECFSFLFVSFWALVLFFLIVFYLSFIRASDVCPICVAPYQTSGIV